MVTLNFLVKKIYELKSNIDKIDAKKINRE